MHSASFSLLPIPTLPGASQADNPDISFYFDFPALSVFFDYYLSRDLYMLALSFALVFFVLWVNTNSIFLAFCGV